MSLLKGLVQGAAQGFVDSAVGKYLGNGGNQEKQGFNAQNIITSLNKTGVAKSSHFEVQFIRRKNGNSIAERDMIYRAESVELPGRSLATVDHRFDNYSPISRVVTGQTYTDVAVTFLLSEDLREKEYFERWQDSAVQTGAFQDTTNDFSKKYPKNNVQYYDDYIGVVEIRQFGSNGELKSIHKLDNAFPIVLGGVQMSWSDESVARLAVSFSYQRYRAVFYHQDQPEKGMNGSFSIGPNGIAGSIGIPGVGTINAGGGRIGGNLSAGGQLLGKKIFSALPSISTPSPSPSQQSGPF